MVSYTDKQKMEFDIRAYNIAFIILTLRLLRYIYMELGQFEIQIS